MKFGIKLWSTNDKLIPLCKEHFSKGDFDYVEISAIIGTFDEKLLSYLKGIPIVVHCDNNDVNFADASNKNNVIAIKEAIKFAEFLDAEYIIIHPGYDGSMENVNKLLREFNDDRFCIENMPGRNIWFKTECIGRTYEELKQSNVKKYCIDFSHAIKAATTLNMDMFQVIKDLLKFEPILFHVCDGHLDSELDEHLAIGDGNFDFRKISELIGKRDAMMSVETPKSDYESLEDDVANVKKAKEYFS